ncbi:uncharacterized protein KY384_008131 [Bacidia gigantensis]|uniref:uncharacterized protein n=1 Tax=Bacidia gigantensis TaxID=2732470 RepID=UPI001D047DCE|nr:uncharacterized protein KY384_008131 [Bacidia gigantensis]KAG8526702.1 hypothetical protein KY384_008131 [Bacidia gigantensis]
MPEDQDEEQITRDAYTHYRNPLEVQRQQSQSIPPVCDPTACQSPLDELPHSLNPSTIITSLEETTAHCRLYTLCTRSTPEIHYTGKAFNLHGLSRQIRNSRIRNLKRAASRPDFLHSEDSHGLKWLVFILPIESAGSDKMKLEPAGSASNARVLSMKSSLPPRIDEHIYLDLEFLQLEECDGDGQSTELETLALKDQMKENSKTSCQTEYARAKQQRRRQAKRQQERNRQIRDQTHNDANCTGVLREECNIPGATRRISSVLISSSTQTDIGGGPLEHSFHSPNHVKDILQGIPLRPRYGQDTRNFQDIEFTVNRASAPSDYDSLMGRLMMVFLKRRWQDSFIDDFFKAACTYCKTRTKPNFTSLALGRVMEIYYQEADPFRPIVCRSLDLKQQGWVKIGLYTIPFAWDEVVSLVIQLQRLPDPYDHNGNHSSCRLADSSLTTEEVQDSSEHHSQTEAITQTPSH